MFLSGAGEGEGGGLTLKGPKHEIFESGFFTQIRGLWLGDFGTGKKN